ncbi:MAG: caspase family protein, partial [Euryarchaeota archaeon]|nr:caspase family protein [Euryarchaeota archaeon]
MKINTKEKISLAIVVILVGTIFLPIQSKPLQASILQNPSKITKDTQYWALVVGIGEYAENPEQNRPGMILEANDFRDLLLQTSWWSADHIKLLTAEDTTRSNILAGFRWLNTMASSDDVVLVYLSTHGNYLPLDIPPQDEADNADEMLVTYWGFAYNTSFITDDQINIMLNQLKSNNVCLIVDSCYAGGFNDHWKLLKSAPEQHRIILMGSREDEEAMSGGFAPYLIDGLRGYADSNGDGIVTAEEAFVYAELRRFSFQTPTIYDGYPGELALTTSTLKKSSSSTSAQQQASTMIQQPHSVGISAETSVLCGYITSDKSNYQLQVIENKTYWANLSLVPRPSETAVICGYISSEQNGTPLAANVSLYWQGSQVDTYRNTTVADENGFYQMNVAPGQVDLDISKDAYYSDSRDGLSITDSQTLPLPGVRIDATWVNFSINQDYTREAQTNASGFFSMPIAPGELYIELHEYEYNYYDPYRHDAPSGKPLWMNISLQQYSISVDVAKPLRALYLNNQRIIPWSST